MDGMFKRVLFATDLSRDCSRVFMGLAELKCMGMGHARILYVMDKDQEAEGFYDVEARANEELAAKKDYLAERGISVDAAVRAGEPAAEILKCAREWGATLVIMGSTPRGALGGLLVGSTAEDVVRGSGVPVFVERLAGGAVPEAHEGVCRVVPFGKVLVPLDFSDASLAVLGRVTKEMRVAAREVVLAHVVVGGWTQAGRLSLAEKAEARLDGLAGGLSAEGLTVRTHVHDGHAAEEIIKIAAEEEAGLVAMSLHGGSGRLKEAVTGGTAMHVLHHSHVSVLVFPEA
ncbi:MAG: universal stress protein [Nitrospirae bacterium]|nr:universal stress protein [Nitrospirota bacterium]